jgi:hypothetical protein
MLEKVGSLREWIVASLVVLLVFAPTAAIVFARSPIHISESVGRACFFFLVLPGMILFFPLIMSNIHNGSIGFIASSILLNWFLYTALLRWILARRRRRRSVAGGGVWRTL